jgi:hypothetical protein
MSYQNPAFTTGTQSLADALAAAHSRDLRGPNGAPNPLIERLATALAVRQHEQTDEDDGDEDLDLPMLVQGERFGAVVPSQAKFHRRREGRAVLLGFGLGLVLLVPLGIMVTSRLTDFVSTQTDQTTSSITSSSLVQSILPAAVATDEVGLRTTRRPTYEVPAAVASATEEAQKVASAPSAPTPLFAPAPPPTLAQLPRADIVAQAKGMIAKGDIDTARALLEGVAGDANPAAVLALAETFDPNMLAAWSARGTAANAERARVLYQQALNLGENRARQRLDALE